MSEFLEVDLLNSTLGYTKKPGKPGPNQPPVALTKEGQPVYNRGGLPRPPIATLQKFKLMDYDDEVERQRRLLTDTALAHLGLEHPRYVQTAVDMVGQSLKTYWGRLKGQVIGKEIDKIDKTVLETIKSIATGSSARIYGPTSFGRRDPQVDKATAASAGGGETAVYIAQIDQWFSPLDRTPRDVPKLMSLYDYFYCKVLGGTATPTAPAFVPNAQQSPEYQRAEMKKPIWRPDWYEKKDPRGRTESKIPARKTIDPGLTSPDFTIPWVGPLERCGLDLLDMKLEERKRGWDMFAIQAGGMNPGFKQSLAQHNLPFSASASGTTSTLFLAAEAFTNISTKPVEEQKQYLLACVIYLVAGGMHTCHEVFWTGKQVGIDVPDGKYIEALPGSFVGSRDYEKWSTEFWDIVRPDRATVR